MNYYYVRVQLNRCTVVDRFVSESDCSEFCQKYGYSYEPISEAEWRVEKWK